MAKIRRVAPTPDADLLALLDELRRQVETGEVEGFAFAAVASDARMSGGWCAGGLDTALIGATSRMLHHLISSTDEAD